MKEKPILFSGEMVRAILEGRKTQTRRVITQQPVNPVTLGYWQSDDTGEYKWSYQTPIKEDGLTFHDLRLVGNGKCPYGTAGDRLWVRETWQTWWLPDDQSDQEDIKCFYRADGEHQFVFQRDEYDGIRKFYTDGFSFSDDWVPEKRWHPAIHMLRSRSRINLEITNLRAERLQEISNNDALAEGTPDIRTIENNYDLRDCYHELWDSINAKRGYGWDKNPWVWVIEFKRVEVPA